MTSVPTGGRRVLMVVSNDARQDAQARASALALVAGGLHVTVLGVASTGRREEVELGGLRIVRVPVSHTLRDAAHDRPRGLRSVLGLDEGQRHALEQQATLRERERTLRSDGAARSGPRHRRLRQAEQVGRRLVDEAASRLPVRASWRRDLPEVGDLALTLSPLIDGLQWDVIHTLDADLVGIASDAVLRRRQGGRTAHWLHEPRVDGVGPSDGEARTRRERTAYQRLEREFIGEAAAVVTEATSLSDAYSKLLGARLASPQRPSDPAHLQERHVVGRVGASVLAIGPANMAGQAWEWARAAERLVPGLRTHVLTVDRGSALSFPSDEIVSAQAYAHDRVWAEGAQADALRTWTHALLESGRPVFGQLNGRDFRGDAGLLRAAGVEVGLVLHGSEIRNPVAHAARSRWSPFTDARDPLTRTLQEKWEHLHPQVLAFDGPVFVSTPDLLLDVPAAHLLPVVVDVARWASDAPVLDREVPRVVHAPSRAALKGTAHVEASVAPLVAEGLIDYVRLEGVAPARIFEIVREADIVLDQFAIGSYGVLATEAMAAGRVVVGHVPLAVRETHESEPPIVEATPDDLSGVLRGILADRDAAREVATRAATYARQFHDGRRSAAVLRDVLGLRGA